MRLISLKKKLKNTLNLISRELSCDILLTDINENTIISNDSVLNVASFNPKTDKSVLEIDNDCKFVLYIKQNEISNNTKSSTGFSLLIKDLITSQISNESEIQNLSQEILDKYEELNLIYDIISELKTEFNEKEICRIILKKASQIIPVHVGFIVLPGRENQSHEIVTSTAENTILTNEERLLMLELANNSLVEKKVVLLKNPVEIKKDFALKYQLKEVPQLLSIPLATGDEFFGSILLIDKMDGTDFTSIDMKLISALTGQAGEAIRSSRLIQEMKESEALRREMQIAHEIQMSLIPQSFPDNLDLDISGICIPSAYAGGDFYGFDEYNDENIMFSIADVCGHGLSSSFIMVSLRSILRSEITWSESLKQCIERSNKILCRDTNTNEKYATLLSLTFNKKKKTVSFIDAGHLPPIYWNNIKRCLEEISIEKGFPLGIFDDNVYIEKELYLNTGDLILLYTDGITETRNGKKEFFGENRLKNLIESNHEKNSEEILQLILHQVKSFREENTQNDDITLVLIKVL